MASMQDDASVMERLMRVLERPYDEQPEHDELAERRPEWARNRPGLFRAVLQLLNGSKHDSTAIGRSRRAFPLAYPAPTGREL